MNIMLECRTTVFLSITILINFLMKKEILNTTKFMFKMIENSLDESKVTQTDTVGAEYVK